jgi:cytidylate kinase
LIIAIDGPAGAGKSTVALELSCRLGYLYIDTGAMYRTLALKLVREGTFECEESVEKVFSQARMHFEGMRDGFRCFLDGEDVSREIRTPEVSQIASVISCFSSVRENMVLMQRDLGKNGGVILEGRDIGTVVFPDADLKIFLDAAPFVRAQRRLLDLEPQGQAVTIEKTLAELLARDERDQNREHSPLTRAEGVMEIDTTRLSFDEVVAYLHSVIGERIRWKEKFARG